MAVIRHPATGLPTGDPELIPLKDRNTWPTRESLDQAVSRLILSASGWRTVFATGDESPERAISGEHTVIAACAARVFARYLKTINPDPVVLIGMDSRPTGPAIADAMARVFLAEGCSIRYLFIAAAPEVMAWAKSLGAISTAATGTDSQVADSARGKATGTQSETNGFEKGKATGFAYISASHNPIGHNGIKFGLTDGGVLPGSEANLLIADFRRLIAEPDAIETAAELLAAADTRALARAYSAATQEKRAANSAYTLFTREVVSDSGELAKQDQFLDALAFAIRERPLGIVADLNGSARCLALDADILTGLGISMDILNGQAGAIAHRIVPEGSSLEDCRLRLEELHHGDSAFVLGYVPDCDGDRGNIVIWDDLRGGARSLEAQEVFALCCVAELAHLARQGHTGKKLAIAINDPTSTRIDRIAEAFGAKVFRAEVGEANVVGLARRLRGEGWTVRILGEGAAGGNITHPSAVRDPIDTVFALVKLLRLRSTADTKGLFEIWCSLSGQTDRYTEEFTLADIIDSLPHLVTTSAYESEAMLKIRSTDHAQLKDRYQKIFEREWQARKVELGSKWGFASYSAWAYTGLEEKAIDTRYGEAGRGGLRILFSGADGRDRGFIWMRGSGTEPVFRVMAEGDTVAMERELLEWQRAMILEADTQEETR